MTQSNDIDKYNTISEFLLRYTKYQTKHTYKAHLKKFFDFIGKNPDEYIQHVSLLEEKERARLIIQYKNDLLRFWHYLREQKVPDDSILSIMFGLKAFFREFEVNFKNGLFNNIKLNSNGNVPVSKETPITRDILQKMLEFSDIKGRAYFLMLASSGMRYNEALQLTMDDIELNSTPTKIIVRAEYTKKRKERVTFISKEATDYLKKWLDIRDDYLRVACERVNNKKKGGIQCWHGTISKSMDDNTIFPFGPSTARTMWNRLLEKAEFTEKDKKTGRYTIRIHGTRKFFESNFQRSQSPRKTVAKDFMIGHKNGMETTYSQFASGELENEYQQAEPYLTIFDISPEEEVFEQEVEKRFEARKEDFKKEIIRDLWERFEKSNNSNIDRISIHNLD